MVISVLKEFKGLQSQASKEANKQPCFKQTIWDHSEQFPCDEISSEKYEIKVEQADPEIKQDQDQ